MTSDLERQYECLCWFETHCPADIPNVQHDMSLYAALRDVRNHPYWKPSDCAASALTRLFREVSW